MSEHYPYHPSEQYEFPRNQIEQAEEELRIYDTPIEFRKNLLGLKRMYEWTACFQSLKQYAAYAADLRTVPEGAVIKSSFNGDFFSGELMAMHVNVAPAPLGTKRAILFNDFLSDLEGNPAKDTIEENIRDFIAEWAGGESNNWAEFLAEQDPRYQKAATMMAERMYDRCDGALERELDFLAGFTFASNLVWHAARSGEKYVR